MVNQDAGEYTFWEANLDKGEDLVAVDEKNRQVDQFCSGVNGIPATSSPASTLTHRPGNGDGGLSKGAIAGVVVGCVAGVALIAGIVFFFVVRRRKLQSGPTGPKHNHETVYAGSQAQFGGYDNKPSPAQPPQELPVKPPKSSSSGLPELP